MKVGKLEREIASVCKKKTIQFNNKWKSAKSLKFMQNISLQNCRIVLCYIF